MHAVCIDIRVSEIATCDMVKLDIVNACVAARSLWK